MKAINLKYLVGALSLVLSTSVSAMEEINIWDGAEHDNAIKEAAADFEKEFNCKVIIQNYPDARQLTKLDALEEGLAPDIFLLSSDKLDYAIDKELIAPNTLMQQDQKLYEKDAVEAFVKEGEIYAVPSSIDSLVVFYNKDLIEYPYEDLNGYKELAQTLKEKGIYSLIGKYNELSVGYGFLASFGGYIFGHDDKGNYDVLDVGINNEGSVLGLKALAEYAKLMPKELFTQDGDILVDEYFKSGKAAAVINGSWAFADYAKSGINYGIAPLPKLDNGKAIHPFYEVKGYAISTKSKHKDLAEKFLQYLNQDKYILARYLDTAKVPALLSALESPLLLSDEFASTVLRQVEDADAMPHVAQAKLIVNPMQKALSEAILARKDPKSALDEAKISIMAQY